MSAAAKRENNVFALGYGFEPVRMCEPYRQLVLANMAEGV